MTELANGSDFAYLRCYCPRYPISYDILLLSGTNLVFMAMALYLWTRLIFKQNDISIFNINVWTKDCAMAWIIDKILVGLFIINCFSVLIQIFGSISVF
jgi:hypothetical protein